MNETDGENKGKLPKNFALKSKTNEKYLRFIHDDKVLRGFLQFSGTKVVSPYSKFEVQDSKTKKGFVHIRCCYNNKYWVRWSARSKYIVASATEPDEDQSKFSCTLFHPIYDHDKEAFRFKHVQLDHYLSLRSFAYEPDFNDCLFAYGNVLNTTSPTKIPSSIRMEYYDKSEPDTNSILYAVGGNALNTASLGETPSKVQMEYSWSKSVAEIAHRNVLNAMSPTEMPSSIGMEYYDKSEPDTNDILYAVGGNALNKMFVGERPSPVQLEYPWPKTLGQILPTIQSEPDPNDGLFAYGNVLNATSPTEMPSSIGMEYYDESELITVVDWDSFFILPKHVAFKGDNGHYLRAHSSGTRYLEFDEPDIGHPSVGNEIFTTPDGYCRIKNDQVGKFWMCDPNWIHVKATEDNFDKPNTLFWPVRLDNSNGVALRNIGNHRFCMRLSVEGKSNCLNTAADSITKKARLEIEELVLQRSIYNVNFHLLDARIYGETPITMTKGEIVNKNSKAEKSKMKLRYEESRESTWSNSVGFKSGMNVSIESGVPEISSQEFEMSAEIKEEHTYGETKVTKTRTEIEHEVVVPPHSKVLAKVLATKGFCDIPYSYTQRDVLTNGKVVVQHFDDGVYTGSNCYNYTFLTEQEAL